MSANNTQAPNYPGTVPNPGDCVLTAPPTDALLLTSVNLTNIPLEKFRQCEKIIG